MQPPKVLLGKSVIVLVPLTLSSESVNLQIDIGEKNVIMSRPISPPQSLRRRPSGTTLVEAAFVLLAFLGLFFLIVDVSWGLFAKVTLQHAVRAGVRYAVTSQTGISGGQPLGQVASIKQVVQQQAIGFLSNSDLSSYMNVKFYSVSSNPPALVTGVGSNAAGNLVVISVDGWNFNSLVPVLHSSAPILITVSSGDLIESNGTGSAPPPL
jgi:Flp pilus assembly protein TadG